MLDENLPTFRLKPSSDNPLSSVSFFTQNGSEPTPEYLLRRADPALPASRNKYAIALCDPYNPDVVYGEVTVEPGWSQPTLSAAEIRAQAQAGAPPAPAVALVPDAFTVQLYNPDQSVSVKLVTGSWNKTYCWEFDLPVQTFRTPTASEVDREQQNTSPAAADLVPRVMFRWKKDGLLSKDMSCYMTGTRLGARKNKEPDITIGLFKAARESILTVYQPNLHRVDVEDRKGLELVLLLTSEVIKDLWLVPKTDMFNVQGGPSSAPNKAKASRPVINTNTSAPAAVPAMSGALAANIPPPQPAASQPNPDVDAETRRLQKLVEREQREREKADRAEQQRIKKMLDDEERERRRREDEVAKETERLRRMYGVEGQQLPSDQPQQQQARPPLPPRNPYQPGSPQQQLSPWGYGPPPMLPPRPVSAGPYSRPPPPPAGWQPQGPPPHGPQQGPFHFRPLNVLWKGTSDGLHQLQNQHQQQPGRRRSGGDGAKVQKKRSSQW